MQAMKYCCKLKFMLFITIALLSSLTHANTCLKKTPTLTSNSSAVISSGIFSSSYPAWKAFDGSHGSMWISKTWQTPAWIGYNFNQSTRINKYTIDYANGRIRSRAPKHFKFQGSNNGTSWTTLDQRTNQTSWAGSEKRSYTVSNPGHYSQYRLNVSDDNDSRSGVVVISMGELILEDCNNNNPQDDIIGQWHRDSSQSEAMIDHFVPTHVPVNIGRFVPALNFYSNGTVEILRIGPADNHYFTGGTWSLSGNLLILNFKDRRLPPSNSPNFTWVYQVLTSDSSNLRLETLYRYPY